jgi:hypothetical protein
LLKRVEFGIARAKGLGLTWQSSIAFFVGLMMEYGPSFSQHALIAPFLNTLQPDLALDAATETLTDEQWEQIDRETDKAWNM